MVTVCVSAYLSIRPGTRDADHSVTRPPDCSVSTVCLHPKAPSNSLSLSLSVSLNVDLVLRPTSYSLLEFGDVFVVMNSALSVSFLCSLCMFVSSDSLS